MSIMNRSWQLGELEISNALVRSATDEGLSTKEGVPTDRLSDVLVRLAKGGVGLIIAGTAYISREGRWGNTSTGMDNDLLIVPLSKVCSSVHQAGGILAAQLIHCGSSIDPNIYSEKEALYGPSAMVDPAVQQPVEELSKNHILKIVDDFQNAARRAKAAGFKAVQIHGAHGYLVNQFLSPFRNLRNDEYGGSIKKRSLFLFQIYEAIRGEVGKEYPVFIKMSAYDGFAGGINPVDAAQVATSLDQMGIDAIEVSAGTPEGAKHDGWDHIRKAPFEEGSLLKYALQIKENVNCPVISVEGWRDPVKIAKTLKRVDAISMCRPFIREPDIANRWLNGDQTPALCVSCNKCLTIAMKSGLGCVFHKRKNKQLP